VSENDADSLIVVGWASMMISLVGQAHLGWTWTHQWDTDCELLQQNLGGCWFHSDEEMEMIFCECLWLQEADFYCSQSFKLVPSVCW